MEAQTNQTSSSYAAQKEKMYLFENLRFFNLGSVNFKFTLKMVPNRLESCAMAHLKAFLQRKNIFAKQSTILVFLGTLTDMLVGIKV